MIQSRNVEINVVSYEVLSGTSKKTGKDYTLLKLQGTIPHEGKNTSDTRMGSEDVIILFENFTDEIKAVFYDKGKMVKKVDCELIFQNFQPQLLKINSVSV